MFGGGKEVMFYAERSVSSAPVPPTRAAWLLIGMRFRQLAHRVGHSIGKNSTVGWPVLLALAGLLGWQSFFSAERLLDHIVDDFGIQALLPAAASILPVLCLASLGGNLGLANKQLSRTGFETEWLLTLPISVRALQIAKVVQLSVANLFGWFTVFPFLTALAWRGGWRAGAPVFALFCCVFLFAVLAIWQRLLEVCARRFLSARGLQGMQVMGSVVGVALFLIGTAPVLSGWLPRAWLDGWVSAATELSRLPLSGPVALALSGRFAASSLLSCLSFAAQAITFGFVAAVALTRLETVGAAAGSAVQASAVARGAGSRRLDRLPSLLQKDLRWFLRSPRQLFETALMSFGAMAAIVMADEWVGAGALLSRPAHTAAAAFGCGVACLSVTSLRCFESETQASWLLLSMPVSPQRIILQKSLLWLPLAVAGALLAFGYGVRNQTLSAAFVGESAYVLFGLFACCVISGALAVSQAAAGADNPIARVLLSYGFLLVCGFFGSLFFMPSAVQRLRIVVFTGVLGFGFFHEAQQVLESLLDKARRKPATPKITDGLLAALAFLLLQSAVQGLSRHYLAVPPSLSAVGAYVVSGAIVALGTFAVMKNRGLPRLSRQLHIDSGASLRGAVRQGFYWLLPTIAFSGAYLFAAARLPWLRMQLTEQMARALPMENPWDSWLAIGLAVVAAPAIEELLFRGLLYSALRSAVRPVSASLLSAAVFTAVHPAAAALPIFCMAVCAALALNRSGSLLSAVLVHAGYNAFMVFFATAQLALPGT